MIASQALFNSYLQGKEICSKDPVQRTEEELIILEQWLLERSSLFKTTTKGTLLLTIKVIVTSSNSYDGFRKVCKHASLTVFKQDQVIYQQEDVVV